MAVSTSFEQLAERLQGRADEFERAYTDLIRTATNAALSSAIIGTPIDLGQAKNNWFVASGAPDVSSVIPSNESIGDTTSAVISRAQISIDTWQIGKGSLFITNNLPYIAPLDRGNSKQAPEGMSKQALSAARQVLRNVRKLLKD